MSPAQALEAFLARLYTDAALRALFLADPMATAAAAGVAPADAACLAAIDRADLELAAASIATKRSG